MSRDRIVFHHYGPESCDTCGEKGEPDGGRWRLFTAISIGDDGQISSFDGTYCSDRCYNRRSWPPPGPLRKAGFVDGG